MFSVINWPSTIASIVKYQLSWSMATHLIWVSIHVCPTKLTTQYEDRQTSGKILLRVGDPEFPYNTVQDQTKEASMPKTSVICASVLIIVTLSHKCCIVTSCSQYREVRSQLNTTLWQRDRRRATADCAVAQHRQREMDVDVCYKVTTYTSIIHDKHLRQVSIVNVIISSRRELDHITSVITVIITINVNHWRKHRYTPEHHAIHSDHEMLLTHIPWQIFPSILI